MTALDLDPIRARLADATPGPWRRGDNQHIAGANKKNGECCYCDHGEPSWEGVRSINGRRMQAHIHTTEESWWDHGVYAERTDGNLIVVNDTAEYGYMDDGDAEFIAHAPADIAALLAEVESLRKRLADVEALHQPVDLWEVDPVSGTWLYGEDDERVKIGQLCSTCTPGDTLEDVCDPGWTEDSDSTFWPCPTVLAARGEPR